MKKRYTIPPLAALTSVGGCEFVAGAWGVSTSIFSLGALFVFVLATCFAGELKVEARSSQTNEVQK